MRPTNKLRWAVRSKYLPPVLQQWWLSDNGVTGEWRDVPMEIVRNENTLRTTESDKD